MSQAIYSFGQWIRQRRRACDFTQKQLAATVGCAAITVKKIEQDSMRPSMELAERLARALRLNQTDSATFIRVARQERSVDWLPKPVQLQDEVTTPSTSILSRRAHIPQPATALIGREHDLQEVFGFIDQQVRLITIIGSPGIGKTRFALEVIHRLARQTNNIAFVDLTAILRPEHVAPAIRAGLQISLDRGSSDLEMICARIETEICYIALDNFEHVLDAALDLASLLQRCPNLTFIITSREPLQLQAEQRFELRPLATPHATQISELTPESALSFSAIQLFVTRAQAYSRHFRLAQSNTTAIATLCSIFDGIPLTLELLAARIATLSPEQILTQFQQAKTGTRLDLFAAGARDAARNHQSLTVAIHWSYRLIEPETQAILRQLAIFADGCSLEAARAVCHTDIPQKQIVPTLSNLIQRSLLQQTTDNTNQTRYRLLVTIREFGLQQLIQSGEEPATHQRHAAYFLGLAEAYRAAPTEEQSFRWGQLDLDRENLRAMLNWFLEQGEITHLFRAIIALEYYWRYTGQLRDGLVWVERALQADNQAIATSDAKLRAWVFMCGGDIQFHRTDAAAANSYFAACQELIEPLNDPLLNANLLYRQGRQADDEQGIPMLVASLDLFQELGDQQFQASILNDLGGRMRWLGRYAESVAYHTESIALYRSIGEEAGAASALALLAQTLVQQGKYAEALQYQLESVFILRQSPHYRMRLAWSLQTLGMIHSSMGAFAEARTTYLESYALFQEIDDGSGLAWNPYDRARIEIRAGQPHLAEPLLRKSLQRFETLHDLRGQAWCYCLLAEVALARNAYAEAAHTLTKTIHLFQRSDLFKDIVATIPIAAAIALVRNQATTAASLLAAEQTLREQQDMPLPPADQPRHEQVVQHVRAALTAQEFEAAWQAGREWGVEMIVTILLGGLAL